MSTMHGPVVCVDINNVHVITMDIITVIILELQRERERERERERTADSKILFGPVWGSSVKCTQIHKYYILLCTYISVVCMQL